MENGAGDESWRSGQLRQLEDSTNVSPAGPGSSSSAAPNSYYAPNHPHPQPQPHHQPPPAPAPTMTRGNFNNAYNGLLQRPDAPINAGPGIFGPRIGTFRSILNSDVGSNPFGGNSFGGNSFGGNSFGGNSFGSNPFGGNSFGGNNFGGTQMQPRGPPVQTEGDVSIRDLNAPSREFRPMESRGRFPVNTQLAPQAQLRNMLAGFSPNYRGNVDLVRNRSADIPASENCSLFILGLPPTITTRELLSHVRDAGRIFATHINPPEPARGHFTAAAKLIFFERAAAERFYNQHAATGLQIRGFPARVLWNRIRSAEQPADQTPRTRVLLISGPPQLANPQHLIRYLESKIEFQIDEVRQIGCDETRNLIEFRFGSYRCQSEVARIALQREYDDLGVRVWFGPDPCDIAPAPNAVQEDP